MTETDIFNPQKKGDQWDLIELDKGSQQERKLLQMGVNQGNVPYHLHVLECPPPGIL